MSVIEALKHRRVARHLVGQLTSQFPARGCELQQFDAAVLAGGPLDQAPFLELIGNAGDIGAVTGEELGGGSQLPVVQALAPAILGVPVDVPSPGEYVALGAARQAAWVLAGGDRPPTWETAAGHRYEAEPTPWLQERFDRVAAQAGALRTR